MVSSALLLTVYVFLLFLLTLFGTHRSWLLLRLRHAGPAQSSAGSLPVLPFLATPPAEEQDVARTWPLVTIQLPLYNERQVAARVIQATSRLEWPKSRLELQVLDDSTDDTTGLARRAVEELTREGFAATLLHRAARSGFKAGALAEGLKQARGEVIALFDADFVPPPDFLRRLVPELKNPEVGMVQARWGHLNPSVSLLTEAQALLLDAHFRIEHASRARAGHFFNFNGTAGIWRRRCIEAAGGWQGDTLTEDLDLSYRAQLLGWKFIYRDDVLAPAELPEALSALRNQQRRWAMGGLQTAQKLLGQVLRAPLPLGLKGDAFFHLTSGGSHLLMLCLALLLPLLTQARSVLPPAELEVLRLVEGGLLVLSLGSLFHLYSAVLPEESTLWTRLRSTLLVMILGSGLAFSLAMGALDALLSRNRPFMRTPKRGNAPRQGAYRSPAGLWPLWEGLLGLWILSGPLTLWFKQGWSWPPSFGPGLWFSCLFASGCFFVCGLGLLEASEEVTGFEREQEGQPASRTVSVQEVNIWTHQ